MNILKKFFKKENDKPDYKEQEEEKDYLVSFKLSNSEIKQTVGYYTDGLDAIRDIERILGNYKHINYLSIDGKTYHSIKTSEVIEVIVSDYEPDEGVKK